MTIKNHTHTPGILVEIGILNKLSIPQQHPTETLNHFKSQVCEFINMLRWEFIKVRKQENKKTRFRARKRSRKRKKKRKHAFDQESEH